MLERSKTAGSPRRSSLLANGVNSYFSEAVSLTAENCWISKMFFSSVSFFQVVAKSMSCRIHENTYNESWDLRLRGTTMGRKSRARWQPFGSLWLYPLTCVHAHCLTAFTLHSSCTRVSHLYVAAVALKTGKSPCQERNRGLQRPCKARP